MFKGYTGMKCDACFWKPHTRQYFSVPTKKNQLIALRHITPAVKVFLSAVIAHTAFWRLPEELQDLQ